MCFALFPRVKYQTGVTLSFKFSHASLQEAGIPACIAWRIRWTDKDLESKFIKQTKCRSFIASNWQPKIISVTNDGARSMMGQGAGAVNL